jgi:hypothetical protein
LRATFPLNHLTSSNLQSVTGKLSPRALAAQSAEPARQSLPGRLDFEYDLYDICGPRARPHDVAQKRRAARADIKGRELGGDTVKEFRKHPLHAKSLIGIGRSAAFAAGLIAMAGTSAQAAESPADTSQTVQPPASPGAPGAQLEEVVVSGIRASLERAMDIKRDADAVVDSISA